MCRLLSTIVLAVVVAGPAWSVPCPDLISAECGGGSAWFGLRGDGANIGQGQTVLLPCEAVLTSVEFYLINNGQPNGGVPPMLMGDPISVTVFDQNMLPRGTATALMPADVGEGWLPFVFVSVTLDPGLYLLVAYTDVPRQASFRFCPSGDAYPDGERYSSLNGLAGPWFPNSGTIDDPFRVHLINGPTDTEAGTWGSVKNLYR
jgi:hypothetical protein